MVENFESSSVRWLNTVEAEIAEESLALNRELLQGWVDHIGVGEIEAIPENAEGVPLTHRRVMARVLYTRYGKIRIWRMGYSQRGHEIIYPLDAAMNLPPSSFSFELQRFVARHVSTTSFTEALKLTKELSGVAIGGRQAIEIIQQCAVDFDAFYQEQEKQSDRKTPILVLTTDGKGIVMRPDGLREGTSERAKKSTRKMRTRLARGEKSNRKRMAQVAAIYAIERFRRTPREVIDELARRRASQRRPRPSQKRVWASIEKNADAVIKGLFEEAQRRDQKQKKEWVVLVDGQKHQMRLVKSLVKQTHATATIIIDIIHVIEYIWVAARLFHEETSNECERWVEDKLELILNGRAGRVAGSIRMSAAKSALSSEQRKIAENCAKYIATRKHYMDYVTYLSKGYPIATGVIEGACRHLIKDRMDLTGARWTLSGAEAILKLRSLVSSGDFDTYWPFRLSQEFQRNHASKFARLEQLKTLMPS